MIAVVVLAAIWLAVDVLRVRAALSDAQRQTDDLALQLRTSGPGGEQAIAQQLGRDVAKARGITHGHVWSFGTHLPVVGDDFDVVARATDAMTDITVHGVPALTDLATQRDSGALGVSDGRIDLSVLSRLTPTVLDADDVFTRGRAKFDSIDLQRAHGLVASRLESVKAKLDEAQSLVHSGATALELAPDMLGEHGKRTYLMVIQNNAELRSTGGIPGAYAELKIDDGRLSIGRQGSGAEAGYFSPPAVESTPDEKALYSTLQANFWNDANFTPDFPRTAEILRAMYRIRFHTHLDGVISVDPIALAHVLVATGPVRVNKDIILEPGTVVPILLNAVYTHYPNDDPAQNAFFSAAARQIFKAFIKGGSDPSRLLRELNAAVAENRILINATSPDEQALLTGTRLSGALPVGPSAHPNLGLYVNDSTAAKLDFYLHRKTTVTAVACDDHGTQTFLTNTVLSSAAPSDVVSLGHSVVGYDFGAKKGEMSMVLTYYAPYGGKVTRVAVDGVDQSVNVARDRGLNVATVAIKLLPGQQHTVTTTIVSGPGQRGTAVFRTTPGVDPTPNNVPVKGSCH